MNSNRDLAQDIKTRRLLADQFSGLLEANRQAIGHWLSEGEPVGDLQIVPENRFYLICPVAVFADIHATPAIGQVLKLGLPGLTVIAVLPTEASLECFQACAEKDGLHQAVAPVPEKDLNAALAGTGENAVLCLVPRLSVLGRGFIAALEAVMSGEDDFRLDEAGTGVCRARAWTRGDVAGLPRTPKPLTGHTPQETRSGFSGPHRLRSLLSSLFRRMRRPLRETVDFSRAPVAQHVDRLLNDDSAMTIPLVGQGALSPADRTIYGKAFEAFASGMIGNAPVKDVPVVTAPDETILSRIDNAILPKERPAGQGILDISTGDTRGPGNRQSVFRQDLAVSENAGGLRITTPSRAIGTVGVEGQAVLQTQAETRVSRFRLHVPPQDLEPRMVTCYLNRGGGGNAMIRTFARGIGCELRYAEDETGYRPGVPIVWGVLRGSDRVVQYAKENNQYFFYIDHAYFSRGHGMNYRITRNGYEAGRIRECPPDRLAAFKIETKPWNREGVVILVCPPTDYFMDAHGCHDWLDTTLATLKSHTDREIVVRRKPQPGETVEPIEEAFRRSYALVTHSSNIAIEAAIAGVPVFVSETSAAAPVGRSDFSQIESPVYPDRTPWLRHLAYNQYSMAELGDGTAWRMLREFETRAFV